MTEVRTLSPSSSKQKGLFATKKYKEGDVILYEQEPLFIFASSGQEEKSNKLIQSQLSLPQNNDKKKKKEKETSFKLIENRSITSSEIEENSTGKFRGMILAACSYAVDIFDSKEQDDDKIKAKREKILSLYHPSFTLEEENQNNENKEEGEEGVEIKLAKQALSYLQKHSRQNTAISSLISQNPFEAIQIMLIWSCNSFENGLLYDQCSRINHSCNFNAIVVEEGKSKNEKQKIKAVCEIQPNDEITISYIGILTYADRFTRQKRLWETKHFICGCTRCSEDDEQDVAGCIPCPKCHPRTLGGGRYLDEDVQYDDDEDVHYAYPLYGAQQQQQQQNEVTTVKCKSCQKETNGGSILKISQKVMDKITSHLLSTSSTKKSKTTQTYKEKSNKEKEATIDQEVNENLYQMSLSILGSKHWCTNLSLLLVLEQTLTSFHSTLLLQSTTSSSSSSSSCQDEEGGLLDMTELAQAIDALQRLWSYIPSLNLKASPCHLLFDVTLGIARTLVSLGDAKSQKYGSEWVEKVETYVDLFYSNDESDENGGGGGMMMKKVVDAIKNSWKRNEEGKNDDNDDAGETKARKRLKTG